MAWTITATQSEEAFFDDHISAILNADTTEFPAHDQRIGHCHVHWNQVAPKIAYVAADPAKGSPEDRLFAVSLVVNQLKPYGFKQAVYDVSAMRKTATWDDIQQKAMRLVQTGAVHLDRNGRENVVATVKGDHGTYQVELFFQDPNAPKAPTGAFCQCNWGHFMNLPRTRIWQDYQNRWCAHVLATYWLSQSVPKDEDRTPGNGGPGQMGLFDMGGGDASSQMGLMRRSPFINPNAWWLSNPMDQMGQMGAGGMQAPSPEGALPQFPGEQTQMDLPPVNPASTPGGRPGPTPTNPIQYPGGTFSSISDMMSHVASLTYQNGQVVRLNKETVGEYVGRPESGMAGQQATVPAGAVGEVLGSMGQGPYEMVNVLWMGKGLDEMSYFQPFGIQFWCFASELSPASNKPPGPAIRRR